MSRKKLDELGVSAFCESMAMMIQAGIATDEAISLLQSDREIGSGVLEQGLAVMKTQVDEGRGLAAAMKESGIFPDYALQMTEAGESSGRLEDTLFRLAAYYKDQKTIAEKLHNAITYPAAMLVLIIAVLAVLLVLVLPASGRAHSAQKQNLRGDPRKHGHVPLYFCPLHLPRKRRDAGRRRTEEHTDGGLRAGGGKAEALRAPHGGRTQLRTGGL